jgi:hypothetical protein
VRRRLPGLPALFSRWALLLATFGAGVAVLQSIGPPAAVAPAPRPEPSAPTAAAVPAPPPRSVLPDAGSLAAAADPHLAHPTSHVATGAETPREPAPTALGGGGPAEAMTPLTAGARRTADDAWSAEASASPAGPNLATTPPYPIAEPARAAVPAPATVAEAPASDVGADAFEEAIASVEPSEGGFQIPAAIPVANGPPAAGDDNATAPSFASATDGPPLRHAPGTADLRASAPTAGAGVPDATTDPPRHAPHVPRAEIPHAAEAVQAGPPAPQRERVASAAAGQGANASVPPSVVAGLPLPSAPPPPPPAAGAKRAPQAAPPWRQAAAGADRPAVATDTPARPAWPLDQRCRDILIRALLGEKPSDASRSYLRAGCGARD